MVNTTIKVQEKILRTIINEKKPITITSISKKSKSTFYQVKSTIEYFERLGILKTLTSEGNTTFVLLNKRGGKTKK